MKALLKSAALALTVLLALQPLFAQEFPTKPIRIVVPFSAGGGTDAIARALADKLAAELQQPVVIDNKPGAGGGLGASVVAHAPADGYTLLLTNNGLAIIPNLQKTDWDPEKDLQAISGVVTFPLLIFVNAGSPFKSLGELVAAAKARPGKLSYGSSGTGGPIHLGMEMFRSAAGIDILHVPYKGNAPMTAALLSNEVDLSMDTLSISLPQVKAGKFRALAVSSPRRLPLLPDVPTIAESGFAGFEVEGWQALFAPARTPPQVLQRLNAAMVKVIAMPAVLQRLAELGYEPRSTTPEAFDQVVQKDLRSYRKVIQESNIKPE